MAKTNFEYACALLLFLAMPSHALGPFVDFDGKSLTENGFWSLTAGKDFQLSPAYERVESNMSIQREVLNIEGDWVELKPILTWLDEGGMLKNQYTVLPGQAMRWTLRCPKGKWSAKTTYKITTDQIGGHYHFEVQPPPLWVSSTSLSSSTSPIHSAPSPIILPEMKGNTTYYYWQAFPGFATRVVEQFEAYGACQGTPQIDYVNVEVRGLLEMPYGENYVLDNPQDPLGYHPDNHYGMKKLIDTLVSVANQYKTAFPEAEPLHFNDMSLPWGGVFDIGYDWKLPHYGHTIGADADINRALVPLENRKKLLEIMCASTPGIALEQDYPTDIPYYHLRVYGKAYPNVPMFGLPNERLIGCCKGNVVDPDTLAACLSAGTAAEK